MWLPSTSRYYHGILFHLSINWNPEPVRCFLCALVYFCATSIFCFSCRFWSCGCAHYFYLRTVSLSLPSCCIRDIIVFATDQDTCFLVDERLSENVIYTQDCDLLQDLLSNTCCGDETDTVSTLAPTRSPVLNSPPELTSEPTNSPVMNVPINSPVSDLTSSPVLERAPIESPETTATESEGGNSNIWAIIGASAGAVLVIGLVAFLLGRRCSKQNNPSEGNLKQPVPVDGSESYPASVSSASPNRGFEATNRARSHQADETISYDSGYPEAYTMPPQ
jgi:hypothetical protein